MDKKPYAIRANRADATKRRRPFMFDIQEMKKISK
jgi:hypothetical protein